MQYSCLLLKIFYTIITCEVKAKPKELKKLQSGELNALYPRTQKTWQMKLQV